jgi:hypothetical protein
MLTIPTSHPGATDTANLDVVRNAENVICNGWKSNIYTTNFDDESEAGSDVGDNEGAFDRNPFETGSGLSPWDDLGEAFEQEAANISKIPLDYRPPLTLELIGVQQKN